MDQNNAQLEHTFQEEVSERLFDWESICLYLEQNFSIEGIKKLYRVAHTIKGTSLVAGHEPLGKFVHEVEVFISLIQSGAEVESAPFVAQLLAAHLVMCRYLETQAIAPDAANAIIDTLKDICSQEQGGTEPASSRILDADSAKASTSLDKDLSIQTKSDSSSKKKSDEVVRVKLSRVDEIYNSVNEAILQAATAKHHLSQDPKANQQLRDTLEICCSKLRNLREHCLSLGHESVNRLFQNLERGARDTARALGKPIKIVKAGEDTEISKAILDQIIGPFIHLVRNAVDHGIEDTATRAKANKPFEGTLSITAHIKSGSFELTISDDGGGIHRDKVRAVAVKKGLISANAILSDEEALRLILLPGFSTQAVATEISGRGVGLDAVDSVIRSLRGRFDIESTEGAGTTFRIMLPTNLSMLHMLAIEVDLSSFMVPLAEVSEVVDIEDITIEENEMKERFFIHRKEVVVLHSFAKHLPSKQLSSEPKKTGIAIINRSGSNPVAFFADRAKVRADVYVKPLDPCLADLIAVVGTSVQGDGKVCLILSLNEISQSKDINLTRRAS